jgi:hypothetical protein
VRIVLAAVVVLLVVPTGIAAEAAAMPVGANQAGPIKGPRVVVTDAQHAALVIHAGDRPLVVQPAMAADPRPAVPSRRSTGIGDWLDAAFKNLALLALGVGALLIWRTRTLQARTSGE